MDESAVHDGSAAVGEWGVSREEISIHWNAEEGTWKLQAPEGMSRKDVIYVLRLVTQGLWETPES